MLKVIPALVAAAAVLTLGSPVNAHNHGGKQNKVDKIHYGGKPGLGHWRRGPKSGYGFGFATYKGDPFGRNDYYDGDRCYYLRHHDFCMNNKIFNGFD